VFQKMVIAGAVAAVVWFVVVKLRGRSDPEKVK
jgi:hypothetical protein